jgi:divalent metal cation (Fe/Co/Zn/Cd) transporter
MWILKEAHQPADRDHPYGHGKFESLGTLTLSAILVGTGVGIGLHALHTIQEMRIEDHVALVPTELALWAAVVSVVVKVRTIAAW